MFDNVQKLWGFCRTLRHHGIDYARTICGVPRMKQEIMRRVESVFALAHQLETRLSAAQRQAWPAEALRRRLDALTPSLLARAFAGKHVPQVPNDEPTYLLLDRLRSQHAAQKGTSK